MRAGIINFICRKRMKGKLYLVESCANVLIEFEILFSSETEIISFRAFQGEREIRDSLESEMFACFNHKNVEFYEL